MKRAVTLLVAVLALVMGGGTAAADQRVGDFYFFDDMPGIVVLNGEIDAGTMRDFRQAMKLRPKTTVVALSSPGGYVDEALALASELHRRGLSTAIPRGYQCYSACAYLFFAGREHVVTGALGVHQVSAEGYSRVYSGDVRVALRRFGTPAEVVKRMFETGPDDLYVFSRKEIARFAINRSAKGSAVTVFAGR